MTVAVPADKVIAEVRRTGSLEAACRELGLCSRTVLRRMRRDPGLAEAIAAARAAGRAAQFQHGRPGSYQRCRCAQCRFAQATRRRQNWRPSSAVRCRACGRDVGTRGGQLYPHYAEPGVVCPEGGQVGGGIRAPFASPAGQSTAPRESRTSPVVKGTRDRIEGAA